MCMLVKGVHVGVDVIMTAERTVCRQHRFTTATAAVVRAEIQATRRPSSRPTQLVVQSAAVPLCRA